MLNSKLADDAVIALDVGENAWWFSRNFWMKHGQKMIMSDYLASMGSGLPGAGAESRELPELADRPAQLRLRSLSTELRKHRDQGCRARGTGGSGRQDTARRQAGHCRYQHGPEEVHVGISCETIRYCSLASLWSAYAIAEALGRTDTYSHSTES